jgi:hypothetical protein
MNHRLDQALVGLLLVLAAGYALMSLGPRALRAALLARLSRVAARVPRIFGLSRWAQSLGAAAAAKPKGACGGCEDCGTGTTSSAQSTPSEIKIPMSKIGRRS